MFRVLGNLLALTAIVALLYGAYEVSSRLWHRELLLDNLQSGDFILLFMGIWTISKIFRSIGRDRGKDSVGEPPLPRPD